MDKDARIKELEEEREYFKRKEKLQKDKGENI